MYNLYRSHIGDGYVVNQEIPEEELVCSLCGKKDVFIGNAKDLKELQDLINKSSLDFSKNFSCELSTIIGNNDLRCENDSGIIRIVQR